MAALEAGALANPDEGRQVGHYWLRDPSIASPEVAAAIEQSHAQVEGLELGPADTVLMIGIGGSALGPQLLADALARPGDPARLLVMDNTDPEGMLRLLASLDPRRTRVIVASKSGGTVETRNGMLAAQGRWREAGLSFEDAAIALTSPGSALDRLAQGQGGPPWSARLPIWDWVGGRTSATGVIGLVPMKLCGWDWRGLLAGAAAMDRHGRGPVEHNPAALLAEAWYLAGKGRGDRSLVILPYRDRLLLVGRYLQQLIMESIGKRLDRQGREVLQGLAVYGNKGSTDQHAFIQQVRDGRDDTFVHFLDCLDPEGSLPLPEGSEASDHLLGFALGTREALREAGRPWLNIGLPRVDAPSLGALIALFERAVGIYAELVDVNAYHQPGVEAGKKAAAGALHCLHRLSAALGEAPQSAEELATTIGAEPALCWRLLEHLASTGRADRLPGGRPSEDRYLRPA
jgi:glucose-6-phosphate isomerase